MQFHLNGFIPGDPDRAPAASGDDGHGASQAPGRAGRLPDAVDVLIVGCGPAGLALAAQLAVFPDIRTAIVEQKDGPMQLGQADGIACRTMEMFEAFGFSEKVQKEACWITEVRFWKPDEQRPGTIVRHARIQDTEDGLSEFPHVILNQARVHDCFLEAMRNAPTRLEPFYGRRLVDLSVDVAAADTAAADAAVADYPVIVRLARVTGAAEGGPGTGGAAAGGAGAGADEVVRARYVVGCDGARSRVRQAIGRRLVGDSANQAWGVMDLLAVTDFPDIRFKTAVQSEHGNLLVIPREGGYLVRIYVEMDRLGEDERVASRGITLAQLVDAARRILQPYTLDVKDVVWWSVYEIGQRLCDRFDDVPAGSGRPPRVFIAGDACHTHSPKAGQGMNVSMQDSFNLGWKLAGVLRGWYVPELLHGYSAERQAVARQLIDFDREWAKMFSDRPQLSSAAAGDGVDPQVFQRYFQQHGRFTAGLGTRYAPSAIRGPDTHQALARGFVIGTRLHSSPVLRIADARPLELGHVARADGRWRLHAFAGRDDAALVALCRFLAEAPASPLRRFAAPGEDVDARFDLRAVFQAPHHDLDIMAMPALLRPSKGRFGLTDYEKVFSSVVPGRPDIFDARGIDREQGALVVVRPDQYVGHVLPLAAHEALAAWFAGFMSS